MKVDALLAAMPGLTTARAQQFVEPLNASMRQFQITNLNRSEHYLAQIGHESLSLRYLEEIHDGSNYEGRKDLGNIYPGDGRRFKGRGPLQVTGRHNYTAAAHATGLDLVNNPQLASQPRYAFVISAWWWWNAGCNQIADGGPGAVQALTRRINGGYNGLADRQARYARVRALGDRVLPGPAPAPAKPPPAPEREQTTAVATLPDGRFETFVQLPSGEIVHRWHAREGGWVKAWESLGTPGK